MNVDPIFLLLFKQLEDKFWTKLNSSDTELREDLPGMKWKICRSDCEIKMWDIGSFSGKWTDFNKDLIYRD